MYVQDEDETFESGVKNTTIGSVLSLTVNEGMQAWHLDVNGFLV